MVTIPLSNLAIAFIPVFVVLIIIWRWNIGLKSSLYAIFRMIIQLLLIGYVLTYIFETNSNYVVIVVLSIMLLSASWISLRTTSLPRKILFINAVSAMVIGGVTVLIIMTQAVLMIDPWYSPSYLIPLAGMIFANCMNAGSQRGFRHHTRGFRHTRAVGPDTHETRLGDRGCLLRGQCSAAASLHSENFKNYSNNSKMIRIILSHHRRRRHCI